MAILIVAVFPSRLSRYIDYRDLAIQQLGSVYEGLLELRPRYATSSMRVVRAKGTGAQDELVVSAAEPVPTGYQPTAITYDAESIYLATDKGERRRSGSYYTPDHIVDHIVQAAIGAKCSEIDTQLRSEIATTEEAFKKARNGNKETLRDRLQSLQGAFDERILSLKILDPAMGSGHFLIRACQYLAEEIATNPNTSDHAADDLKGDDSTITYWKRRVAESCLHGVDANPMAVELAKLALWLETVASDAPLTFLDHHFRRGDSIIGARIARLDSLPGDQGLLAGQFQQQIVSALPTLLNPLEEISHIPSDTAEQVKQKEQIYKRHFLPALQRFSLVGDVWTADAMASSSILRTDYAELLRLLGSPRKFDEYAALGPVRKALSPLAENEVSPFHWELAYPHVFLASRPGGRTGFDVIVGNPPYDVLSERETGHSVEHLKRFIEIDPALHCSRIGKNNLYKIFVARSSELLTEGGLLSFIVPMPLLGDEQSSGIRKMLFDGGRFVELHAFPQKDNPQKRVFRDAKLSTAVFVYQKASPEQGSNSGFTSQLHPAQFIEPSTPRLSLNSNSVKMYDPENLTIVSCRQDDWDLVTQLAEKSNSRFREHVNFFQGEVNQTVATAQGWLAKEGKGPLIMRGANVSLYQLREASQGEDIYLDVAAFLRGKSHDTKAYHHEFERVGLQESSPQNNFRRIISCRIPKGQFCNHKINYATSQHSTISLDLVLFVLNSTFADWYFRLGSTNAAVSHYQLGNIPCPRFGQIKSSVDNAFEKKMGAALIARDFELVDGLCLERAAVDGCSPTVERAISALVHFIETEEAARGKIARTERSSLAPDAERCQIVLDKMMLTLLGLGSEYHTYLRGRVSEML